MFSTIWTLTQVYPLELLTVAVVNWTLGYFIGRAMLRRLLMSKLTVMTRRYLTAHKAAITWKDEVEDLALRVKEED